MLGEPPSPFQKWGSQTSQELLNGAALGWALPNLLLTRREIKVQAEPQGRPFGNANPAERCALFEAPGCQVPAGCSSHRAHPRGCLAPGAPDALSAPPRPPRRVHGAASTSADGAGKGRAGEADAGGDLGCFQLQAWLAKEGWRGGERIHPSHPFCKPVLCHQTGSDPGRVLSGFSWSLLE